MLMKCCIRKRFKMLTKNYIHKIIPFDEAMKFCFLAVDISSSHNSIGDIKSQVNKDSVMSDCLRDVLWQTSICISIEKWEYINCVKPVLTYGIEIRAETNKTKNNEDENAQNHRRKTLTDRVKTSYIIER